MDAKKWGVATSKSKNIDREIVLGENFNQVKYKGQLIKVNSKKYEFERTSKNSFEAYPVGYKKVRLFIETNIRDEKNIDFNFRIDSPDLQVKEPQPGNISVTNPDNAPKVENGNGFWGAVIQAAVELATSLSESGDDCIDKAIRGCGEGNVDSYDEGGWFSGCSFECK